MKLSRAKLLKGCTYTEEIEKLLTQAENTLRTWEPEESLFVSAPVREESFQVFKKISDIKLSSDGGYQNAERQRILLQRNQNCVFENQKKLLLNAIQIEGNFLFDRAEKDDFICAINEAGVKLEQIGDVWLMGDRGAQAICTPEAFDLLSGRSGVIRDVVIQFKPLELKDLRLLKHRTPRKITTVEASKRLDAIASAGFGVSRSKIISHIKKGNLRLNWNQISSASHSLVKGDRIQFEGKGSLEVLHFELTKKERWRVDLLKE